MNACPITYVFTRVRAEIATQGPLSLRSREGGNWGRFCSGAKLTQSRTPSFSFVTHPVAGDRVTTGIRGSAGSVRPGARRPRPTLRTGEDRETALELTVLEGDL